MALIDIIMPRMGESIMECTVIAWLKQPGDRIEADESVLEVATDKVDTEVPAPQAGILKEILVHNGDVVAIGAPIARLETDVTATADPAPPTQTSPATVRTDGLPEPVDELPDEISESARELETSILSMSSRPVATPDKAVATSLTTLADQPAPTFGDRFYSPLVLNIAKEEAISRAELDSIPGTGAGGRLTKKDILAFVSQRTGQAQPTPAAQLATALSEPPAVPAPPRTESQRDVAPSPGVNGRANGSLNGESDLIQMDRMRKLIAQRMVESKQTSPHVSSFVEADLTNIVQWRTRLKDQFKAQTGENLTYTPIFVEAIAKAIRDFPLINVSVEGDAVRVKRSINIGMAVALPTGNLIVPVIHDADQYNLVGLTKRVNDLTKRARENKLTADDLVNGTYTISNIGTFGNLMGTPIIVQPQVAIMAFGAIVKKPAVIETPQGDFIGIRQLMFLSHSYDHRVVDGSLGGQFVRRVADYLEQFDGNRTI